MTNPDYTADVGTPIARKNGENNAQFAARIIAAKTSPNPPPEHQIRAAMGVIRREKA